MTERTYHYRISPGVINNDIFIQSFNLFTDNLVEDDPCCTITTTINPRFLGFTYAYSSMTQIVSGGTNGTSLLTGLTIPILLTENTVDIGYYSVFDGMIYQKDFVTNFIFSGSNLNPYQCILYNTSNLDIKKYLGFSTYTIDWGDGIREQIDNTITTYTHNYLRNGVYTIRLEGTNPWGENIIEKTINIPFSGYSYSNPNGTAFFIPQGGNWSGTPISYDYIYSGDSNCDIDLQVSSNYTTVPFIVSGVTKSRIQDLQVYGPKNVLLSGKYDADIQVTGTSGVVGIVYSPPENGSYTAYTIDNVDYYDFNDGRTIFFVNSSGITEDMIICSAITKNEVLLNVISETQIESNIFVERGTNSALESIMRLGEVDNVGDINKYGYKFFKIKNT